MSHGGNVVVFFLLHGVQMGWEKSEVAAAAVGRWRDIVLSLCSGMPAQSLDGIHERECPKCGGLTRFRPWNDFDARGGVRCNHCFFERNADGFATVQWWHGWDFAAAIKAVAEFLHLATSARPSMAGGSAAQMPARRTPLPPQSPEDWAAKWNQWTAGPGQLADLIGQWITHRPPIEAAAVEASQPMVGNWPLRQRDQIVIGFHGYAEPGQPPNSLLLYRVDGAQFPAVGKLQPRKTHLVGGSKAGWIHVGGIDRTQAAEVIWRVEGLPDGLALLPLLPVNHAVVTPSCGCNWNKNSPERNPSLLIFLGKVLIGCGDADEPGQRGLMRFAADAAAVASRVFLLRLPYSVVESHGKDLRDWRSEGADLTTIQAALVDYGKLLKQADDLFSAVEVDRPAAGGELANYWVVGKSIVPRPIDHLLGELWQMTDRWPRRVNDSLFVHEGPEISWLKNPPAVVAWFGLKTGATVNFARDGGVFSKTELFEALQQSATQYKAVENIPHEPQMPGHYYACGEFPDGDGEHLAWLLARFSVEEDADRDLICLMMATVFWGGGGGQRPAFMITANGTGSGKTTLAAIVAELAGGMISIGQRDGVEKITERMLTAEGRDKRILFVDNIKATRFSSAEIEGLITAPVISGRELYKGESQRPNTLTWIMTMNGVGVGKDIADRVIVIKLKRPEYSGNWTDETLAYVREHRREILCDLLTFLRGPRDPVSRCTRWGAWDLNVVARLPNPDPAIALIKSRQREIDVDSDEAGLVQSYFRDRLVDLRYEVENELIFIPSSVANLWHAAAVNERVGVIKSTQWLRTQIEQGSLPHLLRCRRSDRHGFQWIGECARSTQETDYGLEHRIEMSGKTSGGWVES